MTGITICPNSIFNRLLTPKTEPVLNQLTSIQTLANLLKKCSTLRELESVHATMIKSNTIQDCFLMNQFISKCSTFCRTHYVILAFTQMIDPNVFVYNAVIRSYVQSSYPVHALLSFVDLLRARLCPTSYTFSSIIKACILVGDFQLSEVIHGLIWRYGLESHLFVQTGLIDLYGSLGKNVDSLKVFDEMPERDAFSWTAMVSVYSRLGEMDLAKSLFDAMPERNCISWNTMIDGYSKLGNVESAEYFFHQMPTKDIISWTMMINCYSRGKRFNEALEVFHEMNANGVQPDEVTMSTVISACAHLGALDLAREIHFYLMRNGFHIDVHIGSALIDMFSKCGSVEKALVVFFNLQEKNLFCWNAIIEGLAIHGFGKEALLMFDIMGREKIEPNRVTFVSILSACAHAGLVEEGHRMFLRMTRDFSIHPDIEHYGCVIGLLSKAGLLEEALALIRRMRMEPNSVIWGALLDGCKVHGNFDIALEAVRNLIVLEPSNSGYYSSLLNMYAKENQWGKVAKIRATMKQFGVEKTCVGSSWIEMKRKTHQFAAMDQSHPASNEIYLLLHELDGQLKIAGHDLEGDPRPGEA